MTILPAKYRFDFTYRYFYLTQLNGQTLPALSVELKYGHSSIRLAPQIDTGSEHSMFSQSVGFALGLSPPLINNPIRFSSAGGPVDAFPHTISSLTVLGGPAQNNHILAPFLIYVATSELPRELLGREFLENYQVMFWERAGLIYLEP